MLKRNNFKVHDVEQGTPEWLSLREGYLTASQAGVAMKVAKPLGEISDELQEIFDYGHKVEDLARPLVEATRFKFRKLKTDTATCEVNGIELLASLDGICDGVIWECKSYGFKGRISEDAKLMMDGKVPEKHYWQMQHQMMVFGVKKAFLTAATTRVNDAGIETAWCQRAIEVLANEEDQLKLLERYAEMKTEVVEADDDMQALLDAYSETKQEADKATAMLKAIETDIKEKAKETGAVSVIGNGFKVDMVVRKGSINYKKIPGVEAVNLDDYRGDPVSYFQIKKTDKQA